MFIILSTIVSHLVGVIQTGLSYGWDTCHSSIGAFDLGLLTACHLVGNAQFGIISICISIWVRMITSDEIIKLVFSPKCLVVINTPNVMWSVGKQLFLCDEFI